MRVYGNRKNKGFAYGLGEGVALGTAIGVGRILPYVIIVLAFIALPVILLAGIVAVPIIIVVFAIAILVQLARGIMDGDDCDYEDTPPYEE